MPEHAQRILVVEDEADVASLLRARLEAQGFEVLIESEGRRAVEIAQDFRPDLVILDLMLLDTDGYRVSEGLRRNNSLCMLPILMLTARTESIDKLRGYGAGADAYLTKPYDAVELVSTVRRLLSDARRD